MFYIPAINYAAPTELDAPFDCSIDMSQLRSYYSSIIMQLSQGAYSNYSKAQNEERSAVRGGMTITATAQNQQQSAVGAA